MNVAQRVADWLRERQIKRMSRQMGWLVSCGKTGEARAIYPVWLAALSMRSPAQIERMERRAGLIK